MAEVLGVVTSVFAILQLTGKLVSLGYEYIEGVKDAPNDIQQLVSELLSLSNVLLILQNNIKSIGGDPTQLTALQALNGQNGPLEGCAQELKKLKTKLELNHKTGLEGKIRRLVWPLKEKETMGFLARLERHKALFMLALTADQVTLLKGIEKYVEDISLTVNELKDESLAQKDWMGKKDIDYIRRRRKNIIEWISPDDFDTKHLEICSRRQSGTGEWLSQTLELQNWIKGHPDFWILWGHGIPGAGKTFLSSLVIEKLLLQAPKEEYGVGYIYFDYIEKEQQKPIRVLTSLLKQLVSQMPTLPTEVIELHNKLRGELKRPTPLDIYNLLIATSRNFSRVFLVFDALDECDEREELLQLFHRLSESGISIFLTSRPHPQDIQDSLSSVANIELSAKEEDISSYIQQRIEKNTRAKGVTGKYKDQIISELADCAQGMFLLVRFHVEHICGQTTVRHILKELEKLKAASTNSKKGPLDPTYDRVMDGILKQPENSSELALTVLSWLVKARRTLTIDQLQQALSVEPDPSEYELDELNIPDTTTLLDVCGGLVVIDENTKTVRLAHYTIQEYLLRKNMVPDAELKIATTCVTYLSFDEFTKGGCNSRRSTYEDFSLSWEGRFGTYPFLSYAAKHLSDHLQSCDFSLTTSAFLRFLGNQGSIDSYQQALKFDYYSFYDSSEGETPLNVASAIGHYPAVKYLLENKEDFSSVDKSSITALQNAAAGGHDQVVELLLQEGVDPMAAKRNGFTSLARAAIRGHKTTIQLLLKHGIDFSIPENHNHWQNALNLAASRGYADVVRYLLENGPAQTHNPEISGWASLYYAAMGGHLETVQLLLDHGDGKDISTLNKNGETALHQAVYEGHKEIVQLLLRKGANASIPDDRFGEAAIHKATLGGHEQILQLLLKHGVDTLAPNNNGSTPLHLAVSKGHIGIVRLLLENGDNTNPAKDKKGHTALKIALLEGRGEILRLLLKSEGLAAIFARDAKGRTELHKAAYNGYKDIVCILLENGVDISSKDNKGWTALHNAANRGIFDVAQILVKNGADISDLNNSGYTALLLAAETNMGVVWIHWYTGIALDTWESMYDYESISRMLRNQHENFQLLVEGDPVMPSVPYNSSEFVEVPQAGHYKDVLQLLIEHGADISVRNKSGQSPLHLAAYSGQLESLRLLLKNGADVFARDHDGRTALHTAIMTHGRYRNIGVVYLLLENGVDILAVVEKTGQTALHLTASETWKMGSQLLLERGVDISVKDNSGKTALHLAAYTGSGGSVGLFLKKGASISTLDRTGKTALHIAAARGNSDAVEVLLKNGPDISARDNSGMTPLHWALKSSDDYETIELLLKNGADASAVDNFGQTVLHVMGSWRNGDVIVPLLLEKGADISALDNSRRTALHSTALTGALKSVEILLKNGIDISALDKSGQTALHLAASRGREEVTRLLLENGANLSIEDNSGLTALHKAVVAYETQESAEKSYPFEKLYLLDKPYLFEDSKPVETVRLLIRKGADPSIISNYGEGTMDKIRREALVNFLASDNLIEEPYPVTETYSTETL